MLYGTQIKYIFSQCFVEASCYLPYVCLKTNSDIIKLHILSDQLSEIKTLNYTIKALNPHICMSYMGKYFIVKICL